MGPKQGWLPPGFEAASLADSQALVGGGWEGLLSGLSRLNSSCSPGHRHSVLLARSPAQHLAQCHIAHLSLPQSAAYSDLRLLTGVHAKERVAGGSFYAACLQCAAAPALGVEVL